MSKMIASQQAVFAVADWLKSKGEDPTYERIIEILGGGSNSTVGPHLAAWRQKTSVPPRPVPEPVGIRATILAEAVWIAALGEVQAEIEKAKQAAGVEIEQAAFALSKSIAINQMLEADLKLAAEQVESLKSDCLKAKLELGQVNDLKLALAEAQQCSEDRRRDGEALQREIAMLKGEIVSLKRHGELLLAQLGPRPGPRVATRRSGNSAS
jgi:Plasmid replication region DNA-binding N-term